MNDYLQEGRVNQKKRTRRALMEAADRLLSEGKTPTMAEVAREAETSVATAYRYFSSPEALIADAYFERGTPEPGPLFNDGPTDPVERGLLAEQAVNDLLFSDETAMRVILRNYLDEWLNSPGDNRTSRPARRLPYIEQAVEPLSKNLSHKQLNLLKYALSLPIGTEAIIALRDVCGLSEKEAREVTRWAVAALVKQALSESAEGNGLGNGSA